MNDFAHIIQEIEKTVEALTATAKRLKKSAAKSVNKQCDYEDKKNDYVLSLKKSAKANPDEKVTDAMRESMYRAKFKQERSDALEAAADYESDKILFKGLQSKLNALQTIARLTESELKLGLNFDDKIMDLQAQINDMQQETIQ
jgi:uncharacterized Ntn-hydrolase superfamily protein